MTGNWNVQITNFASSKSNKIGECSLISFCRENLGRKKSIFHMFVFPKDLTYITEDIRELNSCPYYICSYSGRDILELIEFDGESMIQYRTDMDIGMRELEIVHQIEVGAEIMERMKKYNSDYADYFHQTREPEIVEKFYTAQ